jgi:UDP:flavonoid glycosyltransferase YjiC (YdhE family)
VLVSFGTIFTAPGVLGPILRELSAADLDLLATVGLTNSAADYGVDQDRVSFVGFTALDCLLRDVDLVVTHGGAGTTFGALAAGIPLVVVPQAADQFLQADRVAAAGAGLAVLPDAATPQAVARAVATVLAEPSFLASAGAVAAEIAEMPSPDAVAARLEIELATKRSFWC